MKTDRTQLIQAAAARGKYAPLYCHLSSTTGSRWRATFVEIERILGFALPASARLYRPWWSNQNASGGHSLDFAWQAAGWKTEEVDLEAESLVFARADRKSVDAAKGGSTPTVAREFDLDSFWPPIPGGRWPPGFTVSREQIYDSSGRLTGGPQDDAGSER